MNLPRTVSPWVGSAGAPHPSPYAAHAPSPHAPYVGQAWVPTSTWYLLSAASSAASAFHGYKRNAGSRPIPWAAVWGLLGAAFPVIVPAVAVAQGFGKRK